MFRHLRTRLVLSHILPILVFVPLLGLVLLYQLERHYFLDELAKELVTQGALIADFTRHNPQVWQDAKTAALLVQQMDPQTPATIMLLNKQAYLLAASLPEEQTKVGQSINEPIINDALGGKSVWEVDYSNDLHERVVDVAVPVVDSSNQVEGVVRLSHRLTDIQERIRALRWPVLFMLFTGAGISLIIGLVLARSLAAPLLHMTQVMARFNPQKPPELIPEQGPDELKTLAATYNRQNHRLYELERTRKFLLSGIVHELGRPLGSIKAAAQTIEQSQDLALAQELACGIDEHIDQLRIQLDDLALLGEMELQGLRLEREPVDLVALLQTQLYQFERLAAHQALTLHCQITTPLPSIQADPKRIGQIVGNLLHNACKYTPARGQITLSADIEEGSFKTTHVVVCVADNGPGIPIDEQERVFQFFYRSAGVRRIHEGMGIGLALARYLAEAHNGTLTVKSQLGQGTRFTLRLPVAVMVTNKVTPS